MIIIETTTRERLVLVPEERIVCTEHARDATPDDLARAGYVLEAAGAEHIREVIVAAERPLLARAEKAEAELAEARAELADAKNECAGAMRSAHAQYAETVRQRDEARAELARLTAPAERSLDNGELVAAITRGGSYRAEDFDVLDLQEAYRLGAAHVRAEMCLVTRAVGMEADVSLDRHPRGLGERAYTIRVQCPTKPSAIAADVPASEVPARVARLLGEVAR